MTILLTKTWSDTMYAKEISLGARGLKWDQPIGTFYSVKFFVQMHKNEIDVIMKPNCMIAAFMKVQYLQHIYKIQKNLTRAWKYFQV